MKLSALQQEKRKIAVDFGEAGKLHVCYYPARFTRTLQDEMTEIERRVKDKQTRGEPLEGDEAVSSAMLLTKLLASWDLEEEKGQIAPIDAAFMVDQLGFININRITRAIVESLDPNA